MSVLSIHDPNRNDWHDKSVTWCHGHGVQIPNFQLQVTEHEVKRAPEGIPRYHGIITAV